MIFKALATDGWVEKELFGQTEVTTNLKVLTDFAAWGTGKEGQGQNLRLKYIAFLTVHQIWRYALQAWTHS